jgi:hypothetical protein
MKLNNRLFPYPILSPYFNDFKEVDFEADITIIQTPHSVQINTSIKLTEPYIKQMVEDGIIEYVLQLECAMTSYRESIRFSEDTFEYKVSEELLEDKLNIRVFMVASQELEDYGPSHLVEDYDGLKFDLDEFSIIGIASYRSVKIEKEKDQIKNVASIFSIVKKMNNKKSDFLFDVNSDRIRIELPSEYIEKYNILNRNPNNRYALMSIIIAPVLLRTIELLKTDSEDSYSMFKWYDSLLQLIDKKKISLEEDSYLIMQKLLENPLGDALVYLAGGHLMSEDDYED